jgi:hypothetical protein
VIVGGFVAPVGLVVSEADRITVPKNPSIGVTETVEVFPLVAPGATVSAVPETAKLPVGNVLKLKGNELVAVILPVAISAALMLTI